MPSRPRRPQDHRVGTSSALKSLEVHEIRALLERAPREAPYGGTADLDQAFTKRAAVLIPILVRPAAQGVLFTRRTAHLRHHSGQIAFPGGRVEERDRSIEETALRETREEIGLDPLRVQVIGRLDDLHARVSGFRITPVVGVVQHPVELVPDADEVDEIFEVPLEFLLDPVNHAYETRQTDRGTRRVNVIQFGRHRIWGATASMVVELYRRLSD